MNLLPKLRRKVKRESKSTIIKKRNDFSTKTEKNETKKLVKPKLEKESVRISTIQDIKDPLKVSSRLATFTLVSVLKNQGLFSQALEVLDALEEKGESKDSISLERDTIKTLIERSIKEEKVGEKNYFNRQKKLRKVLKDKNLDGMLISNLTNIRYIWFYRLCRYLSSNSRWSIFFNGWAIY